MKFTCRYNLIDGELFLNSTDRTITFIRYSLGEEELYQTWNYKEIRSIQLQKALLNTDLIFELQNNERLRIATSMDIEFIENWIEKFHKEQQNSQKQDSQKQNNIDSTPSSTNERKKNNISVQKTTQSKQKTKDTSAQKSNVEEFDQNKKHDVNKQELSSSKTTYQETDFDKPKEVQQFSTQSSNDHEDRFKQYDLEEIFSSQTKPDLTSSEVEPQKTNQTASNSEEPKENKNCCGCIFWIVLIFFVLGSIT